ncbi:MAG: DUF2914 domain-containing protein [Candidatus Rokubacteria bacterium]|nr:DUF2914 domain-containing protein [Candidatus Rokubacteria bacterium]
MRGALPGPLRRWGMSAGSLGLGLATLFVFRRGLPHVAWIVGYLLLLWLVVTVLAVARAALEERGRHRVVGALEYTIQTLAHGLLLFVLPAYYAAATPSSVNIGFVALVAAGALVTAVDPWYGALVRRHPWRERLLLGFAIFAAASVALALVGVRPIVALVGSAPLAGLALAPAFRWPGAHPWPQALGTAAAVAAAVTALVWYGRAAIPPAPLFLARAVVARDVVALRPVDEVGDEVSAESILGGGGLVAFTAVYAPAGLRQAIEHVWHRNGAVVARIPLATPVAGGRAEGFRTYSRRREWTAPVAGRYRVDVVTASGQLIGRVAFTVTP